MSREITLDTELSTNQVGALLSVSKITVIDWTKKGWLKARRTAGGHRRIRVDDLLDTLITRDAHIPNELEPLTRVRLLIVDDDTKTLRAYERVAKPYRDRLEVATCDNGIRALLMVGTFRPHALLLDVVMPEVNGIEVCRQLKANPETRHVRVLMMSGHFGDQRELADRALAAGADQCLDKPIRFPQVLEMLPSMVERRG